MYLSYTIGPGGKSITCRDCGATSYHPEDIAQHYCAACHRFHNDVHVITFYVIYDHPRDYPNDFVMRKQMSVFVPRHAPFQIQDKACEVGTLEEMRARIPKGAHNLGRHHNDDAVILEVWML